jgi:hypothetical protein
MKISTTNDVLLLLVGAAWLKTAQKSYDPNLSFIKNSYEFCIRRPREIIILVVADREKFLNNCSRFSRGILADSRREELNNPLEHLVIRPTAPDADKK